MDCLTDSAKKIIFNTLGISGIEDCVDMEYKSSSHDSREETNKYLIEENKKYNLS